MARRLRKYKRRAEPPTYEDDPVFIGIDASLVGTAAAVVNTGGELYWVNGWTDSPVAQRTYPHWLSYYKAKDQSDVERLMRIRLMWLWVKQLLDYYGERATVALEGYAFSRGAHAASSDLHELGGWLKQEMLTQCIPFRIYPPSMLKKAWTGSGIADKAQMQMACYRLTGHDFTQVSGKGDGLADAVLLAKLLWWEHQLRQDVVPAHIPKGIKAALTAKVGAGKEKSLPFIERPLTAATTFTYQGVVLGDEAGLLPFVEQEEG